MKSKFYLVSLSCPWESRPILHYLRMLFVHFNSPNRLKNSLLLYWVSGDDSPFNLKGL